MIPSDLGSLRLPLVAEMTRLQVRVVCSYAKRVQMETRWKWREGRCAFASWSCSITKPVVSNTPLMVVQTSFYLTLHLAFLSVRAVATLSTIQYCSKAIQSSPGQAMPSFLLYLFHSNCSIYCRPRNPRTSMAQAPPHLPRDQSRTLPPSNQ